MILCTNCGKENQDHYKFCLGCGAKLAGSAAAAARPPQQQPQAQQQRPPVPKPPAPKTAVAANPRIPEIPTPPPIAGMSAPLPPPVVGPSPGLSIPSVVNRPAATPAAPPPAAAPLPPVMAPPAAPPPPSPAAPAAPSTPPAAAAPQGNSCTTCGTPNPPGFRFCGNCGARLGGGAPAPAPSPAPAPAPVAPPIAAPAPAAGPRLRANLTLIRIDGSEGGTIPIEGGPTVFGRIFGPPFDADYYLSPRHCSLTVLADGLLVDDKGGLNGVYRKLHGRTDLQDGDMFRVGQELLYYEDLPEPSTHPDGAERMGSPNPGYWGRISLLIDGKTPCEAYPIEGNEFSIGRERGDLTFPLDGYVSSSHCRIVGDDSGVYLEDRGSSNGTYIRIRSGATVPYGSLILAGQQLFRIDRA